MTSCFQSKELLFRCSRDKSLTTVRLRYSLSLNLIHRLSSLTHSSLTCSKSIMGPSRLIVNATVTNEHSAVVHPLGHDLSRMEWYIQATIVKIYQTNALTARHRTMIKHAPSSTEQLPIWTKQLPTQIGKAQLR